MYEKIKNILKWLQRLVPICVIVFIVVTISLFFPLIYEDIIWDGRASGEEIFGFLFYMVPALIILVFLLIGWKSDLYGGILFIALSIAFFVNFVLYDFYYNNYWTNFYPNLILFRRLYYLFQFIILCSALPLFITGLLHLTIVLLSYFSQDKKLRKKKSLERKQRELQRWAEKSQRGRL